MNVEVIDPKVLIYALDSDSGVRHGKSVDLIERLTLAGNGALSTQVLTEFYSVGTRKLGMRSEEAEEVIRDLASWKLHTPGHRDVVTAIGMQRKHQVAWWDAMILNSALELDAAVLWSEDFSHGQTFGSLTVRNPFL